MKPLVDLHCHYVSQDPNALDNFRRLVESPDVCRVAVCALDLKLPRDGRFPFMSDFATTNEQLAEFVALLASPKVVPWCHIDPLAKDAARAAERWLTEGGMKGIKMYPPSGWHPNDPRAMEVYAVALEHKAPILMHMGRVASHPQLRSDFARPIHLEEVGMTYPDLTLIIGHFAAPWEKEAAHIAMSFPNFYFDLTTSGHWDVALIRQVADAYGQYEADGLRRFVLGTDGNGSNNLQIAAQTAERLQHGGLTAARIDRIFHDNGLAVLGEAVVRG